MYYESGAKYFWISFVTSLIVSSIMSFVFIVFVSPYITQKTIEVEVPNLKGMKEDQASLVAKNKGLLLMVSQKRDDPNYEDGVVLDQDPLPGFTTGKGNLVKVTLNERAVTETTADMVPDIRGQELMLAKNRIEQAGYVVGKIEFKESETYLKDLVINSTPLPGTELKKGNIVNIVVSTGVSKITVPNLYRKTKSKASKSLEKSGLKLGRVRYTTNTELPFDIIVSQDPSSGTKVKSGSSVDIVINHEGIY